MVPAAMDGDDVGNATEIVFSPDQFVRFVDVAVLSQLNVEP